MLRYVILAATLAAAPAVARAQDTTHRHDSSVVERKSKSTVDNAGEGAKKANDQVDKGAYKVGTDVKNFFRGKKKKPAKPDSTVKHDSTPH